LPAKWAHGFVPAIDANLPTPGLGLADRLAQYGFNAQAALAILLIRRSGQPLSSQSTAEQLKDCV
jgi:hypothetical protein